MAEEKNEQIPVAQPLDDGAGDEASAALDAVVEEAVGAEDSGESAEATADEMLDDSAAPETSEDIQAEPVEQAISEAAPEQDAAEADKAVESVSASASEVTQQVAQAEQDASSSASISQGDAAVLETKEPQGIGHLVAVGIIALILGVLLCLPTFLATLPTSEGYDVTGGVAAQVDKVQIGENDITNAIAKIRTTQGFAEDEQWGKMLVSNNMTPEDARSVVIEQFVSDELLKQAAEENGVQITEQAIDEGFEQEKKNYEEEMKLYGINEEFEQMLTQQGMTTDDVKDAIKKSLMRTELGKKVVTDLQGISDADILAVLKMYHPDAVSEDAETLEGVDESIVAEVREQFEGYERDQGLTNWLNTYREGKKIKINDMPKGLPYDIDLSPYQNEANAMDGMMEEDAGVEVGNDADSELEDAEPEIVAVEEEPEEASNASASSASSESASKSA